MEIFKLYTQNKKSCLIYQKNIKALTEIDFLNISTQELLCIILSQNFFQKKVLKYVNKLFNKASGLYQIAKFSFEELINFGLSSKQAISLKSALELGRRWVHEMEEPLIEVNNSYDVYKYIYPKMKGLTKEVFTVLLLNSQNQIIRNIESFQGSSHEVNVYVSELMEIGLKYHAVSFIFIHNHPSGLSKPSYKDKKLTKKLVFAGEILKIQVIDHIIIGESEFFSFMDAELISEYRKLYSNVQD